MRNRGAAGTRGGGLRPGRIVDRSGDPERRDPRGRSRVQSGSPRERASRPVAASSRTSRWSSTARCGTRSVLDSVRHDGVREIDLRADPAYTGTQVTATCSPVTTCATRCGPPARTTARTGVDTYIVSRDARPVGRTVTVVVTSVESSTTSRVLSLGRVRSVVREHDALETSCVLERQAPELKPSRSRGCRRSASHRETSSTGRSFPLSEARAITTVASAESRRFSAIYPSASAAGSP